jgi:hypothetical protein
LKIPAASARATPILRHFEPLRACRTIRPPRLFGVRPQNFSPFERRKATNGKR